jgi:hypothetical protein
MFSCGIIINFLEMNKSEGNVLVTKFIERTNYILNDSIKYICYDNECHIASISEILDNKFLLSVFSLLFLFFLELKEFFV